MRILGLDLGSKRIGVAVTDEMGWTAQGLTVIQRKSKKRDLEIISKLVQEQDVEKIILGLPFNMDGTEGKQAAYTRRFAQTLQQHLQIPVTLWDERLTSWEAEGILKQAGVKPRKRREVIDKLAASLILKSYLQSLNEISEGEQLD